MKKWWRARRYRTCKVCGAEFRKSKPVMPSLVGWSYCSRVCEHIAWDRWITRLWRA